MAVSEYYPNFSLTGLLGTATTGGGLSSTRAAQANGMLGVRWRDCRNSAKPHPLSCKADVNAW